MTGEPRKLYRAGARFYPLSFFEAAYRAQVFALKNLIGKAFDHYILYFDGNRMHSMRVVEELETLRPRMREYLLSTDFLAGAKDRQEEVIRFTEEIKEKRHKPAVTIQKFIELYPYCMPAFYITNMWPDDIPEDKRIAVFGVAEAERKASDEMVAALDEFINHHIAFGTIDFFDFTLGTNITEEKEKLKQGFVFYSGAMHYMPWEEFLKQNNFVFEEEKPADDIREFKGVPAHNGCVTGPVKVVYTPNELSRVEEGDVLVSPMTLQSFAPVLNKISAIVTDEGGMLCHAAIVSREFKIPCVIGTKIATKVLKDGDVVEVDAHIGKVTIISHS